MEISIEELKKEMKTISDLSADLKHSADEFLLAPEKFAVQSSERMANISRDLRSRVVKIDHLLHGNARAKNG